MDFVFLCGGAGLRVDHLHLAAALLSPCAARLALLQLHGQQPPPATTAWPARAQQPAPHHHDRPHPLERRRTSHARTDALHAPGPTPCLRSPSRIANQARPPRQPPPGPRLRPNHHHAPERPLPRLPQLGHPLPPPRQAARRPAPKFPQPTGFARSLPAPCFRARSANRRVPHSTAGGAAKPGSAGQSRPAVPCCSPGECRRMYPAVPAPILVYIDSV
nr:lysine-rich arabinogalactan protein 19-like [Lolium perenne]